MPEIVNCPSCQRKLQVPESLLGQDVQCPTCNSTFVASVGGELSAGGSSPPPLSASSSYRAEPPARRDYDDYDRPSRRHRDYLPHRGGTILAFGIIAFVACWPIFGPMAWIMGNSDLAEMRAGRMDPEGEGMTNAGRICGMIALLLNLGILLLTCLFLIVVFGIIGAAEGFK